MVSMDFLEENEDRETELPQRGHTISDLMETGRTLAEYKKVIRRLTRHLISMAYFDNGIRADENRTEDGIVPMLLNECPPPLYDSDDEDFILGCFYRRKRMHLRSMPPPSSRMYARLVGGDSGLCPGGKEAEGPNRRVGGKNQRDGGSARGKKCSSVWPRSG